MTAEKGQSARSLGAETGTTYSDWRTGKFGAERDENKYLLYIILCKLLKIKDMSEREGFEPYTDVDTT